MLAEMYIHPWTSLRLTVHRWMGYALQAGDTEGAALHAPVSLEVIDTIYAGGYSRKKVAGGSAIRLMTGSPIPPDGADCIIRQEDTRADAAGRQVKILKQLRSWDNYCFKGENFKKKEILFS